MNENSFSIHLGFIHLCNTAAVNFPTALSLPRFVILLIAGLGLVLAAQANDPTVAFTSTSTRDWLRSTTKGTNSAAASMLVP